MNLTYRILFGHYKEGKVLEGKQYPYFLKEKILSSSNFTVMVGWSWHLSNCSNPIPEWRFTSLLFNTMHLPIFFGSGLFKIDTWNILIKKKKTRFDGEQGFACLSSIESERLLWAEAVCRPVGARRSRQLRRHGAASQYVSIVCHTRPHTLSL